MIWNDFIKNLDSKIRDGQIAVAHLELAKLKKIEIPRAQLVVIANFARRVRLETWGLQILKPVLRPTIPITPPPSIDEWTIYAALLIKIGAVAEALEILDSQTERNYPAVLLYSAFAYFAEWNYESAIPLLTKYLENSTIDPYARAIAGVNLVSALIYTERFDQAEILLRQLCVDCSTNYWNLLFSNCCELLAQVKIQQAKWSDVNPLLSLAQQHTSEHTQYKLFVDKWRCIAQLMRSQSETALLELRSVRDRAQILRNWETVRELDYFEGLILENANLLTHVFFGTPFTSYKERIRQIFLAKDWTFEATYIWKPFPGPTDRFFDLTQLQDNFGQAQIKPGQLLHRLLIILTGDFYQSFSIGTLFSKLFPGEYFNPDSSADRIFQAVKIARIWFEKNKFPLEIDIHEGQYRLKAHAAFAFRIDDNVKKVTPEDYYLKILHDHFKYKSFSVSKAAAIAGVSVTLMREVLKTALDAGKLYVSGHGRSTLYRFEK